MTGSLNSVARYSDTPVTISVEDGTAIAGTDFTSVSDFTLTIPANETRGTTTFNLVPTNDDVDETDETLSVTGSATGLAVDSATMTITDNDTASSKVTLSVNPTVVSEGAGSTTVTVTGTLDGGARTSLTAVTVSVDSGTATAGTDFDTVTYFTLTIPANEMRGTATFDLVPTNDDVDEGNETLTVSGTANGLNVDSATLTITDDDTLAWSVSVAPSTIAEADTGSSTVTVSTDGVTFTDARTVTLDFTGSTATETTDYTVGSKTLTLGAGSTSVTTTITAVDDTAAEPNEQVKVGGLYRIVDRRAHSRVA